MVGVVGVTHGIRTSEEHLEADVRDLLSQLPQALPGVFVEEAHGGVEGSTSPHFQRKQAALGITHTARQGVGAGEHIEAPHACGHERLVSVAEGRVGNEQSLLLESPFGKLLRPEFEEKVSGTLGKGCGQIGLGQRGWVEGLGRPVPLGMRVAVDDDVAQEIKQFGGPVFAAAEGEEFGRGVDQRRRGLSAAELRMKNDVFEEGNIGFDPADPEFRESPVHAIHGDLVGLPGRDHLDQH